MSEQWIPQPRARANDNANELQDTPSAGKSTGATQSSTPGSRNHNVLRRALRGISTKGQSTTAVLQQLIQDLQKRGEVPAELVLGTSMKVEEVFPPINIFETGCESSLPTHNKMVAFSLAVKYGLKILKLGSSTFVVSKKNKSIFDQAHKSLYDAAFKAKDIRFGGTRVSSTFDVVWCVAAIAGLATTDEKTEHVIGSHRDTIQHCNVILLVLGAHPFINRDLTPNSAFAKMPGDRVIKTEFGGVMLHSSNDTRWNLELLDQEEYTDEHHELLLNFVKQNIVFDENTGFALSSQTIENTVNTFVLSSDSLAFRVKSFRASGQAKTAGREAGSYLTYTTGKRVKRGTRVLKIYYGTPSTSAHNRYPSYSLGSITRVTVYPHQHMRGRFGLGDPSLAGTILNNAMEHTHGKLFFLI